MNTKTRDSLTVLREVDSALLSRRLTPFECGELHEAIAKVEALVELARVCLLDLADSTLDGHMKRYDLLREAIAAFTPSQNSENNS